MFLEKNIIKKMQVEVNTNSLAKGLQIKDDIDRFLKEEIFQELD
jgi:hypothetical protein